jgi:hypothetical protein
MFYAHCAVCGNLELRRISPDCVTSRTAALARFLHLPALRCDPCRNKFFSARPLRRGGQSVPAASSDWT